MSTSIRKLTRGGIDSWLERLARHGDEAGRGEGLGCWTGAAATSLGLDGQVATDTLRAVLAGRHPVTGTQLQLTQRRDSETLGIDVTFSAPKTVSVVYALATARERAVIVAVHAEAVAAGLDHLDTHACVARLGSAGKDRQPGQGLIAACFPHHTCTAGEAQLHTHTVIAAIVTTPDGRAATADLGLVHRRRQPAGAAYDVALRAALTRELGAGWDQQARGGRESG
ncbi:MAG: MobF family relaxase [Egibacteraceae bacterium]